jgi:two-component system, cell cycle response regulator DivK
MSKILYVEDNFQNFRLVMRMLMLEQQKYDIVQAATGQDGLRMAAEIKPDLILMDINLPDIDGVECTRRIKADPAIKHIPVVALTANAMVGDKESYLAAGCDAYLRKPLARADLQNVLANFLHAKVEVKRVTTGLLRLRNEPEPRSI